MIEEEKSESVLPETASWSTAFMFASKYFAETVVVVVFMLLVSNCGGCINIDSWMR